MQRRQFLQSTLAAAGLPLAGWGQRRAIDESSPDNIKICHRLNAQSVTDDDLHYLQQIGVRRGRLEWGQGNIPLDTLRAAEQRFAKFGMQIYSGVHYAYRSTRLQLGQAGRDQDIEMYSNFVRDLGKLGIPVASYDW